MAIAVRVTRKRAASTTVPVVNAISPPAKKVRTVKSKIKETIIVPPIEPNPSLIKNVGPTDPRSLLVSSKLTFDLQEGKNHLIAADARFGPMFERLPCKPYEDSEDTEDQSGMMLEKGKVNPWRSLATSIIGQQVSWLAAKAINYRFSRLYFPELPEKQESGAPPPPFPTPDRVAVTSKETLRGIGFSYRKAEYVIGLAERFTDGRLDSEGLMKMSDEDIMEHLCEVRGVGKWTVEMYLMFTARRPDILPCGDLGIQKGLIRWFGWDVPNIAAQKLVYTNKRTTEDTTTTEEMELALINTTLPVTSLASPPNTPGTNDVAPTTPKRSRKPKVSLPPTPESPESLAKDFIPSPPFPESATLTRTKLRARLTNKKTKGAYLTPEEMEELTESWKPYRSIGCYYLWALTEGADSPTI